MKDYLEGKGGSFKPAPKDTIRLAQESGFISCAQELIDGLDLRNELSHDYSGDKFKKSEEVIRKETFPAFESLYQFFSSEAAL